MPQEPTSSSVPPPVFHRLPVLSLNYESVSGLSIHCVRAFLIQSFTSLKPTTWQPVKPLSEWRVETGSMAVLLSLVCHPSQLLHILTNASWNWWPICSPNLKISSNVCMFMCNFQNTMTQMILFPFCWTKLERFWLICSRSLSHSEWSWLCVCFILKRVFAQLCH